MRRVQLQGGARGPHARRTPCTLSVRPRAPTKQMGPSPRSGQGEEKGPAARRRPKAAREAYSLYVERAAEGANEADGPLSSPWYPSIMATRPARARSKSAAKGGAARRPAPRAAALPDLGQYGRLAEYNRKRHFGVTPEPAGK